MKLLLLISCLSSLLSGTPRHLSTTKIPYHSGWHSTHMSPFSLGTKLVVKRPGRAVGWLRFRNRLVTSQLRRLRRASRRRNWLFTLLLLLSLASFLVSRFLTESPPAQAQIWGQLLLAVMLLALIVVMWWGTTLRQAAQPGANSKAYIQASLRAFRFRRTIFNWFAVPYLALIGVEVMLLHWPRFHVNGLADWWKLALWMAAFVTLGLVSRRVCLRRYEHEFGPAERVVEHWQITWTDKTALDS